MAHEAAEVGGVGQEVLLLALLLLNRGAAAYLMVEPQRLMILWQVVVVVLALGLKVLGLQLAGLAAPGRFLVAQVLSTSHRLLFLEPLAGVVLTMVTWL